MDQKTQEKLISLLPRLRRFAFGLTGTMEDVDDYHQVADINAHHEPENQSDLKQVAAVMKRAGSF